MSSKRKNLSKRLRFEVFKRDRFTCQYCGAIAPDVVLHVDHIEPVSKGGDNDMLNLITACSTCNSGKSNIELCDDAAVQKQRAMIDELSQRREQIEMMLSWREGLKTIDDELQQRVIDAWTAVTPGWHLNDAGIVSIRKMLKTYSIVEVLDAIDTVSENYLRIGDDGLATEESVIEAWQKIPALCRVARMPEEERSLLYIRGICRNRFHYCNDRICLELLKEAHSYGVESEELSEIAKQSRNWTEWRNQMLSLITERSE